MEAWNRIQASQLRLKRTELRFELPPTAGRKDFGV
jgi:hypothetical protein